jgi:hypothetical protein
MNFFYDESGTFLANEQVCVVMGVTISEHVYSQVETEFNEFRREKVHPCREAKGQKLNDGARLRFAQRLGSIYGLFFTPVVLDFNLALRHTSELRGIKESTLDFLESEAKRDVEHESYFLKLKYVVNRLSQEQLLRLYGWASAVSESFPYAVVFGAHGSFKNDWESIAFFFDRVPQSARSNYMEKRSLIGLLRVWIDLWSEARPIPLDQAVFTTGHPLMKWHTGKGLNIGQLFTENVHILESRNCTGIQIADVAANIVSRAARIASECSVEAFRELMRGTPRGGVVFPTLMPNPPQVVLKKYEHLCEAPRST